jgi:hypothetical protein
MPRSTRSGFRNPLAGIVGGPVVALIGLGIAWFGWNVRAQTLEFIEASDRAEGTVVQVVSQARTSNGEQKTYFYPVIEFVTRDGESVRFQDSTGSNPPEYREGERVQVLYDPLTPESARIESFAGLWLMPTVLLGFGAVFVLFGVLGFFNSLLWILGIAGLLGIWAWLLTRKRTEPEP